MISPLLIIAVAVALFLLFVGVIYNKLATGRVRINEALSSIDVQLKRRTDLIPNLIETVKGYADHEKTVFEDVTKARSAMLSAQTPKEKAESNNMLTGALKSLFAVSENYPQLRASENFSKLQEELSDTENKIAYSRQFYNTNVRDYNTTLANFPSGNLGKMFGFSPAEFFETADADREPVKVKF